jgi:1-acyl-sn-glycerol-3-phosphate acyltransferase
MTPWPLLLTTILLLVIPWLLLRLERWPDRADDLHEIRGPLRWLYRGFQAYCAAWHGLRADRYAPLPATGPAILIANHTCGIDHMLLQAASRRLLGFMVAREYYESPWLNWITSHVGCIPVNRDGRDLSATRAALRALGEGRVVPIFPEGRILPASGRDLGPMRPGSAYIAIRAGVPVVPAYILGTPKTDEILEALATPSRARIVFGDPIGLSDIPRDRAGDKEVQAEVSGRFLAALLALQAQAIAAEEDGDAPIARS